MWTRLPAHREGPPPKWPLPKITAREKVIWEREWKRGQATMWEALEWTVQVAMYVRVLARSELENSSMDSIKVARGMEIDLGISYPGLQRNRWILAAEPRADVPEGETPMPARQVVSGPSAKDRLRKRGMGIVDGGEGA
jgi:hypothetical protein